MVLVWTITAKKAPVRANIGDTASAVVVPRMMMILVIAVVPVGTNIDDNDSVFFHG